MFNILIIKINKYYIINLKEIQFLTNQKKKLNF